MMRFFCKINVLFIVCLVLFLFVVPGCVEAFELQGLKKSGGAAGYTVSGGERTVLDVVGLVVGAILSLVGVVLVGLLFYAGFEWMTAAGGADKVKKAQDTIKRALIGLVIIVSAYGITNLVLGVLKSDGESGVGKGDILNDGVPDNNDSQ